VLVPFNGRGKAFSERCSRSEPKPVLSAGYVQTTPRLAVLLTGIPRDSALEGTKAGNNFHQFADETSCGVPRLTGSAPSYRSAARTRPSMQSGAYRKRARGGSVAPTHDLRRAGIPGLQTLADQGGNYVRCLKVEIVARAVEIHRQKVDGIRSVLLAVSLALNQQSLFWRCRTARSFPPDNRPTGRLRKKARA